MKNFAKKLFEIVKPFKRVIFIMLAFLVANTALGVISPYLYGKIIDSIIAKDSIVKTFLFIAATGGLYLLANLTEHFKNIFELKNFDYAFVAYISKLTLDKMLSFSIGQHVNQHSGVKQGVVKKGEAAIKNFISFLIYSVLRG